VSSKTYAQYCPIAAGLDRIGERWTLLILRELSFGPKRFTDLREALPGIAPNLLSERLRGLEADGLVTQTELPPPASRTVYVLTETGREIRTLLRAVARFGLQFLEPPGDNEVRPANAVFGILASLFDPVAAIDADLVIGFELDGDELTMGVAHGYFVRPELGRAPDVTITGSAAALVEVCQGASLSAVAPRLEAHGTRAAKRAFTKAFQLTA
jgi:DNA-binding HxlR family transcriptional regulator